ncbi:thymidylate kinase [Motilibacter rhizosphaerae]|uniref:Thymidylate kinase n=1 Tax=Motilibacter rhizosphaerae TaxID=598652 RepID=A0A4Q7NAM4_9ACTN|nr:dTMP kinase [Motilibacter rhizosphaerae]RZS79402.1 thymidylate kinase [Motilibacter rhizosphaerae]
MSANAATGLGGDVRGALAVAPFRKLWTALCFASMGDWLGLLALTAYAQSLSDGSYRGANAAVAGVFLLRLAPAMVLGPLAGVVADRLDRRWTMVASCAVRVVVIATIPLVGQLWWLYVATLLVESASLFFIPAKEATVPNLVPRERLEAANQLNLAGTYGSAPVAAVLFVGLSLLAEALHAADTGSSFSAATAALWVNAATFLVAAVVIARLTEIPPRPTAEPGSEPSAWRLLVDGWRYVAATPVVRGLVFAMLGAFAAGGAVIGLGRTYVTDLGAGDAGYGLLFFAVFAGLALGMFFGPRLLPGFSRRRLLCLAIVLAGAALAVLALSPSIVLSVLLTVLLGGFAGTSWVTAYTLIGLEVDDAVRGRVFASLNVMLRVVLVAVLALAPLLAAAIGRRDVRPGGGVTWTLPGAAITLLVAGLLAVLLGSVSFRTMDDRRGVRVTDDLVASLRGRRLREVDDDARAAGFFLVLEGGEGAGKSTQAAALAEWIRARGHEVVVSREPGGTPVGGRVREIVLDPATGALVPEAEALLYAADRAQHVGTVVRPALERGAVVISDRYVDSSLAYQGAGRQLLVDDVARLSRWATGGLVPDLTVVLDLPAAVGAERRRVRDGGAGDRLEAEPDDFHDRVRRSFLELAAAAPQRYLVVDASQSAEQVTEQLCQRLCGVLPLSERERTEQEAARLAQARVIADQRREAEERRRAEAAQRRTEAAERRQADQERRAAAAQEAQRAAAVAAAARTAAEQRARAEAERAAEQLAAAQALERAAAAERAAAEQEAADRRAAEQRAADERAAVERAAAERRAADERAVEERAAEQRPGPADEPGDLDPDRTVALAPVVHPDPAPTVERPRSAVDPAPTLDLTDELLSWGEPAGDGEAGR